MQSAEHSCSRATPVNVSTMLSSSAWHCPSEEQEHRAGPEAQFEHSCMVVLVEKVKQERGKGEASAEAQVTAWQGGESRQICWQSSGVGIRVYCAPAGGAHLSSALRLSSTLGV